MDEAEKAQLNKQKKLVDCVDAINHVLSAFDNFEEHKSKLLLMIEGFDLTHGDTYLELTKSIRRELFVIKFFARSAALDLAEYHQLCHPEQKIYSVKQRKIRARYNSESDNAHSHISLKKLESIIEAERKFNSNKAQQELDELQARLMGASEEKKQRQQRRTERIERIKLRLLRLSWAILLLFLLQMAILIRFFQL